MTSRGRGVLMSILSLACSLFYQFIYLLKPTSNMQNKFSLEPWQWKFVSLSWPVVTIFTPIQYLSNYPQTYKDYKGTNFRDSIHHWILIQCRRADEH